METRLASAGLMPRFGKRYVDDLCATIRKTKVENALHLPNRLYPPISTHSGGEKGRSIAFLEPTVEVKQKKLDLEIFRKLTIAKQVILSTLSHPHQHKVASFNHLIYWMFTLSIFSQRVVKKTKHIFEVTKLNRYTALTISRLTSKRKKTLQRQALTKLISYQQPKRRVASEFNEIFFSL